MIKLHINWEENLIEAHQRNTWERQDQWRSYLRRTLKGRIKEIRGLVKEGKAVILDKDEQEDGIKDNK